MQIQHKILRKMSLLFPSIVIFCPALPRELVTMATLNDMSLRQVLFDIRAGNSNLAKSLSEKNNHAMYQDDNPHRCLLSLQM